jgi:hypothetical protein
MTSIAPTPAAAVPDRGPYQREAWTRALLKSSLHPHARLLGLALAHLSGDGGYLPPGGPQHGEQLAAATGLFGKHVRLSLSQLGQRGFLSRPPMETWHEEAVRPLTLTMPPAATPASVAAVGAQRTEPAHPAQAAS